MVNPYKCGRCKVFYDSDILLQNRGGAHHLPVSCTSCPYTICHVCYTEWLIDGKQGYIACPDCETPKGFHSQRPNILPFACQLLAARAAAAAAMLTTVHQSVAVTPPLKKPKQKHSDSDMKPAASDPRTPSSKKPKQKESDSNMKPAASTRRERSNPTKQKRAKAESGGAEITEEERKALEKYEIVSGMNEWLEKVVKVSKNNQRNVIRKVEMLCAGDGLSVSTWLDGISFMNGSKVNLSMDFDDMLNEAKEWEAKYGRDPGNGWALKHPIMYLAKYQKYILEEKLRNPVCQSEQSAFVPTTPESNKQQQSHSESEAEPILSFPASPAREKQQSAKPESQEMPLEVTEEELVALENHEVVNDMREWLEKVVKATDETQKTVLEKVEKLCDGAGLQISTWPDDVSFMEGYEVNLSMDFDHMLNETKAQEAKYGQDPDDGWAMRRPIQFLCNYQRYVLEEKLRKIQPALVTPLPKENKRKRDDSFHQAEPVASASPAKPAAAKKQRCANPSSEEVDVSEEEIEALENHEIVSGISEWLDNVAKVSKTNKSNVVKKVEKLCAGEGIHVAGWPTDVFFMKGHQVNLAMDFDDMLKEAKAYETKYGKDKSNGWGLRHPISNLRKYQKYVLEDELRK